MNENEIKLENDAVESGTHPETVNETGSENQETETATDTITLTQEDLNKRIQSAEDKLRTKYSAKIKALEKQIEEAKPVEKSEAEKDYEERLAKLGRHEPLDQRDRHQSALTQARGTHALRRKRAEGGHRKVAEHQPEAVHS